MRRLPSSRLERTSVRTCCAGVRPIGQTPGCALVESDVSASTMMSRALATVAVALVSAAVSGPTIKPSPAAAAAVAAAAAPFGVLPVSCTSNALAGPGNASRAASSIDCPS